MKLEKLSLDKFKKKELKNPKVIFGGKAEPETGCCDAPDCDTGNGSDSYPDESDPCGTNH